MSDKRIFNSIPSDSELDLIDDDGLDGLEEPDKAIAAKEDEINAAEFESQPRQQQPQHQHQQILHLDIEGWEGPLSLLLDLSRRQKVDLREISILELVEQYLAYIREAVSLKLELAADYLVMAAWLAYLKSALLLLDDPEVDPSPEILAMRLQLRLQRLDAMREAGARLMARDRLGRDVFIFGQPQGLKTITKTRFSCSLFDLMQGYSRVQIRGRPAVHMVKSRRVMTLEDALANLSHMLGMALDWTELEAFLPADAPPDLRRSARASSFLAALELARLGKLELEQEGAFAPLMIRACA